MYQPALTERYIRTVYVLPLRVPLSVICSSQSQRELVASVSDQERFVKVAAADGQVVKVSRVVPQVLPVSHMDSSPSFPQPLQTIPLEPTTTVTDIVK